MDLVDDQTKEVIKEAFQRYQRSDDGSSEAGYLTDKEVQLALADLGTKVDDDDAQILVEENSPETLRVDLKKFTLIALANCTFEATSQKSSSRVRKVSSAKIKETFTEFDSSQSGQIDSNSAKEALLKLGIKFSSDIVDKMVQQADQDADGKITLQEFEGIMTES